MHRRGEPLIVYDIRQKQLGRVAAIAEGFRVEGASIRPCRHKELRRWANLIGSIERTIEKDTCAGVPETEDSWRESQTTRRSHQKGWEDGIESVQVQPLERETESYWENERDQAVIGDSVAERALLQEGNRGSRESVQSQPNQLTYSSGVYEIPAMSWMMWDVVWNSFWITMSDSLNEYIRRAVLLGINLWLFCSGNWRNAIDIAIPYESTEKSIGEGASGRGGSSQKVSPQLGPWLQTTELMDIGRGGGKFQLPEWAIAVISEL